MTLTSIFWAILGVGLYLGYCIGSRADRIMAKLDRISDLLYQIKQGERD